MILLFIIFQWQVTKVLHKSGESTPKSPFRFPNFWVNYNFSTNIHEFLKLASLFHFLFHFLPATMTTQILIFFYLSDK